MDNSNCSSPTEHGRGGWGAVCPTSIDLTNRGDLALVHRAVVNGWDVPTHIREQICAQLGDAMDAAGDNPRRILKVAKLALAMEATNLILRGVPSSRVRPRLRRREPERRGPRRVSSTPGHRSDSDAHSLLALAPPRILRPLLAEFLAALEI